MMNRDPSAASIRVATGLNHRPRSIRVATVLAAIIRRINILCIPICRPRQLGGVRCLLLLGALLQRQSTAKLSPGVD